MSNIPFNASGGAGGGGNLGPIVQSADSGVIADTNGNVCVYHSTCSGSGWNTPVGGAIGGTFTFGAGEVSSGTQKTDGFYIGPFQFTGNSDGFGFGKAYIGPGAGTGAGYLSCTVTIYACN